MNDSVKTNRNFQRNRDSKGTSGTLAGSHYLIPDEPGRYYALILAGLMHILLFLFLWVGIRWQNKEVLGVDAEIWDMTTREAAPKIVTEIAPPAPEPVPESPPPPPVPEVKGPSPQQLAEAKAAEKTSKKKA